MVIVFPGARGIDFIVQTSIAFSLAKINFSLRPCDLRVHQFSPLIDLANTIGLALVGHGSPGAIQGYSAAQIGDVLADPVRGVTKKLRKLIVTSCYAGVRPDPATPASLVEVLAEKLRHRGLGGLEIVGYNGPSIKNAELGFHATVVNDPTPGSRPPSFELEIARIISGETQKETIGDMAHWSKMTVDEIAGLGKSAAVASSQFYSRFIEDLEFNNLTLKGDAVARVAIVAD